MKLYEITRDKTNNELNKELEFQLNMGNLIGETICSFILNEKGGADE